MMTAAPSTVPAIRELTFDDYEATAALELVNGLRARPREQWERQWSTNPAYDGSLPMGWVLEDEESGRVTGTLSNIPLLYTFRGRAIRAVTGRGWAVDPAFRPFAAMLLLEYFGQDADLMLSTTVNGEACGSHELVDQERCIVGDWSASAFRITNHYGFARAALRLKHLPGLLAPAVAGAFWLQDRLTGPYGGARSPGEVEVGSVFDERFDAFWSELQERKWSKLLGVRSRAVLAWHFAHAEKRILTLTRGGRMIAYAVLIRADRSGVTRYRVADLQYLDESVAPLLAREAIAVAESEKVHALELVGLGLSAMRAFESVMGRRRQLPAWSYFFRAPDADLMHDLIDPDVWEPSSFDGDSSL